MCCYGRLCSLQGSRLTNLFQHLLLSPAPLVVHNGWVDLIFLYHSFYAPLPATLDSLMADLTQMLGRPGLYDTKAITEYKLSQETSFLEYIYKKALVTNQRDERSARPCLELSFAHYPTLPGSCLDQVVLPCQPSLSALELEEIRMCPNVMVSGFTASHTHTHRSHIYTNTSHTCHTHTAAWLV